MAPWGLRVWSWQHFGDLEVRLGSFGRSWGVLGRTWGELVAFRGRLGRLLGHRKDSCGLLGGALGVSRGRLAAFGGSCELLGEFGSPLSKVNMHKTNLN